MRARGSALKGGSCCGLVRVEGRRRRGGGGRCAGQCFGSDGARRRRRHGRDGRDGGGVPVIQKLAESAAFSFSLFLFSGAQTEREDAPLDVEFRDAGFVGEDVADELVDVLSRVGGLDALFVGVLGEARLVLEFEFGIAVLGVDVVAYPDKLLVVVGAREEDDGDADQVARGDPVR